MTVLRHKRLPLAFLAVAVIAACGLGFGFVVRRSTSTAALERRSRQGSASYDELVELGRRYLTQGRLLDAGGVAFRARKAQPTRWSAYALIGEVFARSNESRKADEYFQKAADLGPLEPQLQLARFRVSHGMPVDALSGLEVLVTREPKSAEAWLLLGESRQELGQTFEAEAAFRRALALQPRLAEANRGLGILEMGFDHYGPAVGYFERAYSLGDHSAATRQALASALLMRGHSADATHAEQLLAEGPIPDTPSAQFARALLLRSQRRYEEAAKLFRGIPASDQTHERAVFLLADCLRAMGRTAAAEREMEAYQQLVETRQQLGLLTQQLQQGSTTPSLHRDLGKVLLKSGRPEAAAEQFREWAKLVPADPDAQHWLAKARTAQAKSARAPAGATP